MSKRPTEIELEALLHATGQDRARFLDLLKTLPEDVDPVLGARAALSLIRENVPSLWLFARTCRRLPAPVIRAALELLGEDRRPHAFFLRECVPYEARDSELTAAWNTALQALLDLDTSYAWGSKQRKAKLQALAKSPAVLQAIQTAVVACERVSLDMLAVLAADASDASLDALIPHVERAVTKQDWELDRLQRLRTHARSTPAMDATFARLEALYDTRQARSPALVLAQELGFGELDTFWFQTHIASPAIGEVPAYRYQVHLHVDSRSATWFGVSLTEVSPTGPGPWKTTRFTNEKEQQDALGTGTCEPTGFPRWLAATASKLNTRWSFDTMALRTNLRGRSRERLGRWLREEA